MHKQNIIKGPTGVFFFVGRTDARLVYITKDGGEPTAKQFENARIAGPQIAGLKTRTWATKQAAEIAAASLQKVAK